MNPATVHVVIVNWNSGAQLRECLQSFAAVADDDVAARVTVIDNASTDGSSEGLEASMPLAVVRNADNRGFGAACNQGAAGSEADFLLFLNPDTRLMPGSFAEPVRYLRAHENERVGIVGIQLVDTDGRVARNTARAPTAWSMVGNSVGFDRLAPRLFPPHFVTEWAHDQTRTVDQVMGAFFLVRRSLFEALGGFDERFFVYYEDLDFSVRARAQGWQSVYLSTAQAFHRGQGTTEGATARRTFYFCRSRILYARKHFGALGALAVTLATLALEPLARLAAAPRSAGDTLRAFAMLWRDLRNLFSSRC
ncbi:MAG TPA: glycosyltransferase family 2 protein [Burkholderiales bacterium]|nr:glycosyltransferase family 2 protein [Burkholderiales bacterium]